MHTPDCPLNNNPIYRMADVAAPVLIALAALVVITLLFNF